jgi:hypothetical protein
VLTKSDTSVLKMNDTFGKRILEHIKQLPTMEIVVRCTEVALANLRELQAGKHSPVGPSAQLSGARSKSDFPQGFCQTKAMEDTRGVWAGHYAGADLAQFRRLLEHRHFDACAAQSERRSESADPGTDYDHSHRGLTFRPLSVAPSVRNGMTQLPFQLRLEDRPTVPPTGFDRYRAPPSDT